MFDPKLHPDGPENFWDDPAQPDEPDIPLAQGLKTKVTNKSGSSGKPAKNTAQFPSAAALEAAAYNFPEMMPPSAESLDVNAPPGVLEAELRRLLGDWNRGLDVLGDLVANVDGLTSGVGSSSSGGGASGSRAVGGRGRAAQKHGHGHGHGHGRGRGAGDVMDTGISMGELSMSGVDEFDLNPDTDMSGATITAADETPDSAPAPQCPAPATEE